MQKGFPPEHGCELFAHSLEHLLQAARQTGKHIIDWLMDWLIDDDQCSSFSLLFCLPFRAETDIMMHPQMGQKFGIPTFYGHVKSATETFFQYN
jgi:hypothetical protein